MPHCALRYCNNHSRKSNKSGNGITFHRFPRPGNEKRDQWIKFVQKDRSENMWFPSQYSCICSSHFREEDCYNTKNGRRLLKKSAVPVTGTSPASPLYVHVCLSGTESISDTDSLIDTESIADIIEVEEADTSLTPIIQLKEADTPIIQVKKDLKKIIPTKQAKNKKKRYLKSRKQKILTDVIKELKSHFFVESLIEHENELLQQAAVVQKYINALTKREKMKRKTTYSACVRKFALTLNYFSATAYKYVRNIYKNALPHPRKLNRWYRSVQAEPGFTEEAFTTLKLKSANTLPENPLVCSLVFDERSIRQHKLFKNKRLSLVNYGNGPQEEKATQVLIFMLVSLTENWKIPVGYFLIAGIGAETKTTLIKICLDKCHQVGVRVVSLTLDGCKANLNAAKALGCQFSDVANMKTYFSHPSTSENVYVFIDPRQVIKLIRDEFESKKFFFDENNKKVKWQLLVNLNKLLQNDRLKFPKKESSRHNYFRNQVMKVKIATQLLSMDAAKALELCDEVLKSSRFSESAATVKFITLMNNLFDILNSQSCLVDNKSPLCCENRDNLFELLNNIKGYILSLQIQVKQTRIIQRPNRYSRIILNILRKGVVNSHKQTGFTEAIICIESLKNMYREIVEDKEIMTSISTYRLSRKHLDLFLGCIGKCEGNNKSLDVIQLRAAYKKILSHMTLKSSFTENCIPLDNFSILATNSVNIINCTSGADRYEDEEFRVHQNESKFLNSDMEASVNCDILAEKLNSETLTSVSKLIIGYISGYVACKLVKAIKCEECVANIPTNIKLWHHKLITLKDMGGMCYSSDNVFRVCLKTEAFIRSLIKENGGKSLPLKYISVNYIVANTLKMFLGADIFQDMRLHSLQQPCTFNHRTHLIRAIIEKYIVIRLHHQTSTGPDISLLNTKRHKFNKLILFKKK